MEEIEENITKHVDDNVEFKYKKVDLSIVTWLAKNINISENDESNATTEEIKDMLENQVAISYLLIWPIMEQRHFGGFLKIEDIDKAAKKLKKYYDDELKTVIEPIFLHFHQRYKVVQGRNRLLSRLDNHIFTNPKYRVFLNTFKQKIEDLSNEDKIRTVLYVIYRFRNNIFHGNKSIENWANSETEINYCIKAMMCVADCMKKQSIKIS